jgi:hypothetical protein
VVSGGASVDSVRLFEHVHGHLGWLAVAALVHPAVLLRRPNQRARWAVVAAAAVVTAAGVGGMALYPRYRVELRPPIFAAAPTLGYLFERKEHLAFAALLFAWAGAAAYFGASTLDGDARRSLRRAAHWAFVVAAAFAMSTACLGTLVASYRSFGDLR